MLNQVFSIHEVLIIGGLFFLSGIGMSSCYELYRYCKRWEDKNDNK